MVASLTVLTTGLCPWWAGWGGAALPSSRGGGTEPLVQWPVPQVLSSPLAAFSGVTGLVHPPRAYSLAQCIGQVSLVGCTSLLLPQCLSSTIVGRRTSSRL